MPFDPTKPEDDSPLVSAEMRGQLTAVFDELSQSLAAAVEGSVGVPDLQLTISDPPTQAELQQVLARLNLLISALHRQA